MDVVYTGEMDEVINGESFAKKLLCNKIKWFLHGNYIIAMFFGKMSYLFRGNTILGMI